MTWTHTKKDSDEVKKIFFEAKRKQEDKPHCPYLVTKKEYDTLKASGIEMYNYEIVDDFLKRARRFRY